MQFFFLVQINSTELHGSIKKKIDALVCLGGNGTNTTASLLSEAGFKVIGMPKTIDNDIVGTDETFGFHTAIDVATQGIESIRTTAKSHSRCMVVEIMGHKVGYLLRPETVW